MAGVSDLNVASFPNLEADIALSGQNVTITLTFTSNAAAQIYFESLCECAGSGHSFKLSFHEPTIVDDGEEGGSCQ